MSLELIKVVVENFIFDTRDELLLIKGKWGVGKTYFWQRLIEESMNKKCVGRTYYSYVSLFGINSLEELKNAIIASRVESNPNKIMKKFDKLTANLRQLVARGFEKIPKLREYTGGMASEFLYYLIDNTLICFDDIERKGDNLSIKDVFGVAAVLKEQRGCKVLLIMNDEGLDPKSQDEFKLHGEKIIDRLIQFSITTEETYSYIFQPSYRHYDLIKKSCLALNIQNIRILQRINRSIEDITPYLKGAEDKVVEDVISSLILFVWSYFDKASNAPPLTYILDFSPARNYIRREYKKEEEPPEYKRWDEIISSYNYFHTFDDLDKCLAEFVETGYIDRQKFADELNKKNEQVRAHKGDAAYGKVWDIYRNSFEDNEEEFVSELMNGFRTNMQYLTLSDLQSAVSALREFERDILADTLVNEYFSLRDNEKDIEAIRKMENTIFVKDIRDEYLLKRLRDIWTSKKVDKRSLADMLEANIDRENWNYDDVRHMNSFSVDDYYDYFKTAKAYDLYFKVRMCLDFGERNDPDGIYKSISEKTKAALIKLAAESRINKKRVSTLYKIDLS